MNASKTLSAAIAAATIVGAVGFVSAQTTDSSTPSAQPMQQQTPSTANADMSSPPYVAPQSDSATAPSNAPSSESMTKPAGTSSNDTPLQTEPEPKADRN